MARERREERPVRERREERPLKERSIRGKPVREYDARASFPCFDSFSGVLCSPSTY